MSVQISNIEDILVFFSGIILLIIAIIFLSLFIRYKRRKFFLIFLASLAAAVQMVIRNLDVLFPEDWSSEIPNLLAAIFGFIMVLLILVVLLVPEKHLPITFEEKIQKKKPNQENSSSDKTLPEKILPKKPPEE